LAFLNGKSQNGNSRNGDTHSATVAVAGPELATRTPIVETIDLWRVYRLGDLEIPALRGLNLTIGEGELIALKGRSGSGKTTLLNCIGGLDRPTKGSIRIMGEEIGNWSKASSQSGAVIRSASFSNRWVCFRPSLPMKMLN